MSAVNRKYAPGYGGTVSLDSTDYPIQGWTATPDAGLWDSTSSQSGGWMEQEAAIQKVDFEFTFNVKLGSGVPTLPVFTVGITLPAIFKIFGVVAYQGNVIIAGMSTKPDLKGGVAIDIKATSQGAMTGTLVPSNLVVTPPTS